MIKVILREGEIVALPYTGRATWEVSQTGLLTVMDGDGSTLGTFPHGAWSGVMVGKGVISE